MERTFSTDRFLHSRLRNRLLSDKTKKLLVIKTNYFKIDNSASADDDSDYADDDDCNYEEDDDPLNTGLRDEDDNPYVSDADYDSD